MSTVVILVRNTIVQNNKSTLAESRLIQTGFEHPHAVSTGFP